MCVGHQQAHRGRRPLHTYRNKQFGTSLGLPCQHPSHWPLSSHESSVLFVQTSLKEKPPNLMFGRYNCLMLVKPPLPLGMGLTAVVQPPNFFVYPTGAVVVVADLVVVAAALVTAPPAVSPPPRSACVVVTLIVWLVAGLVYEKSVKSPTSCGW